MTGGANLCNAQLREAILRGCDLSSVKGNLQQHQLAGPDLTGATLPTPLMKLFDDLEAVEDISESARKLFFAMLVSCLYSWLAVATTTNVNLITNRASLPLPIIQTTIPIVGFYVVAPLLLLCVYFYFHFYFCSGGASFPTTTFTGRLCRWNCWHFQSPRRFFFIAWQPPRCAGPSANLFPGGAR
jgi:hypothetical protein